MKHPPTVAIATLPYLLTLKLKRTLFVTEGKDSSTVAEFVDDLEKHNGKADNIKYVSSDMSPAFIKGVEANLPNAGVVFDKFHVIKIINEAVDAVRKEESQNNPILKNSRYVLRPLQNPEETVILSSAKNLNALKTCYL